MAKTSPAFPALTDRWLLPGNGANRPLLNPLVMRVTLRQAGLAAPELMTCLGPEYPGAPGE